jgi:hypothetical protein
MMENPSRICHPRTDKSSPGAKLSCAYVDRAIMIDFYMQLTLRLRLYLRQNYARS